MAEPIRLAPLDAAQRAALRTDDRIVIADGTTHRIGGLLTEQERHSGTYTKIVTYSLTADCWLNLHTGYPAHDPRAITDLDRVATYYDARELAADLDAARTLAEHLRTTEPHKYAATLALLADPGVWTDPDGLCVCPAARRGKHQPGRVSGCRAGHDDPPSGMSDDAIDLRALVDALRTAGLDAALETEGGGHVALITVGPVVRDDDGQDRHTLLLGGWSTRTAHGFYGLTGDFHIGPDDGRGVPDLTVTTTTDVHRIAATTAEIHRQRSNGAATVTGIDPL